MRRPAISAGAGERQEMKAAWSVAVVYESVKTREAGAAFCDCLVQRFRHQHGFDVSWWPFSLLTDSPVSGEALQKAVEADLLIFAASAHTELPEPVRDWIEHWLLLRGEREGALVGLPVAGDVPLAGPAQLHLHLREIAHRAGMDYLTEVPQNLGQPIPDSAEFFCERAQMVTSLLDEILSQSELRPHSP